MTSRIGISQTYTISINLQVKWSTRPQLLLTKHDHLLEIKEFFVTFVRLTVIASLITNYFFSLLFIQINKYARLYLSFVLFGFSISRVSVIHLFRCGWLLSLTLGEKDFKQLEQQSYITFGVYSFVLSRSTPRVLFNGFSPSFNTYA